MSSGGTVNASPHESRSVAYHFDWEFRKDAFLWSNNVATHVNLRPIALDLYKWLLRQGTLRHTGTENWPNSVSYTNPYTNSGSVLSLAYAEISNNSAAFVTSKRKLTPLEAEVMRIRLYNENVLYSARICETVIKQMLYCTSFRKKDYRDAALGSLMSKQCYSCKKAGDAHDTSFMGSLVHRYGFCHQYERCLSEHLRLANRRRNTEAAHASVASFRPKSATEARNQMAHDLDEIGNELVHMLKHIGDVETAMINELNMAIEARPR